VVLYFKAGGKNPLDASGVHPEAYPVVEKILQATAQSIQDLMGNAGVVRQLDAKQFIDDQFGLPTVQDIFKELEKPGRDPRGEFKTAVFAEGVEEITDLKPGMILEGEEGEVKQYRLVGCDEFDPAKNWISIDSPVARALIGKGVDDEIHVETPSGKVVLYVNRIWYEK
jgi:hypothetical protein